MENKNVLRIKQIFSLFLLLVVFYCNAIAQISPGELSKVHAHLKGISYCTQCHTFGDKVSSDKCLTCHTEIQGRIKSKKGYHVSKEVQGKDCATCHSDHHGKTFQIVRFEPEKFNHTLSGFNLLGAHIKKKCKDCHVDKFIDDKKIKEKEFTYLGLNPACAKCHADYHQNTLSQTCSNCHGNNSFKKAEKFNHEKAKYKLIGKHQKVDCIKCHKIEQKEEKKFQIFTGIEYKACTNCHKDIHENQFGKNCLQCHTEESFHAIKGIQNFDHTKTKYKLEEKHLIVTCKACHKKKYTDPLKYKKCTDCHADYHKNQFVKNGVSPDCFACHDLKGFKSTSYTIEQHNKSIFPLVGAHLASPCLDCHKKELLWSFKEIGKRCSDCHKNIHKDLINDKYYPNTTCEICHTVNYWNEVNFDHNKTEFKLIGAHVKLTCRACHFKETKDGLKQQFIKLSVSCSSCHTDKHYKQFDKNGITNCNNCHETENWKASKFDHNNTAFKLNGKHEKVACAKCHKLKVENENKFIKYKISVKCESCHL